MEDMKNIIILSSVDSVRDVLKNHNVNGATDKEIQTLIDIYQGHGYDISFDSEKDTFFRIYQNPNITTEDMIGKDGYDEVGDLGQLLFDGWEMISELAGERWEDLENDSSEDCINDWKDCCERANMLSDLYSLYLDKDGEYQYIITEVKRSNFSPDIETTTSTFDHELGAKRDFCEMVKIILDKETHIEDLSGECDFSNDLQLKKFLYDLREESEIRLTYSEGSTDIYLIKNSTKKKSEDQSSIEFYCVTEFYQKFDIYDTFLETRHYRTKEEAEESYIWTVNEFKNKYIEDGKLGEFDTLDEEECESGMSFNLFIDDLCRAEVSLEKVVL